MNRVLPDHDQLVELLRRDPGAYEALRRELIEGLIESAPAEIKPRLRGLQFRIDGVRRCSHTALGATVRLYDMMWRSFLALNDELTNFPHASSRGSGATARILPFPRRGRSLSA